MSTLPRSFSGGVLRRLRDADRAAFQAYRSIPDLGRYQGWSVMNDEQAASFIREVNALPLFAPGEWLQLAIADAHTDALIGDIGLCVAADGRSAEVGFTLAPGAQGRGIATAAVIETARLVFEGTGAERVIGITDGRNAPSIRLLERIGFRRESDREVVFRGEPCTERVYALARATLPARSRGGHP